MAPQPFQPQSSPPLHQYLISIFSHRTRSISRKLLHELHLTLSRISTSISSTYYVKRFTTLPLYDRLFLLLSLLFFWEFVSNGTILRILTPTVVAHDAYNSLTTVPRMLNIAEPVRWEDRSQWGGPVFDYTEEGELYLNRNPHDVRFVGHMKDLKGNNQAHKGWKTWWSQRAWVLGVQRDVVEGNRFMW